MVQLTLPKNSRITTGKTWPKPQGVTNLRKSKTCIRISGGNFDLKKIALGMQVY